MERYRKLKVIGKGSFGYAVLVQSVQDRLTYVMKIIDVSKMDRKQREDAINEVHVLKAMRHPYIITYKESFMDKRCLCIVMDYADGGDLYTKIANQKKIGKGKYLQSDSFCQLCSVLFGGPDSRLVCLNGSCDKTHTRSENSSQRFENAKHFHDSEWPSQNW